MPSTLYTFRRLGLTVAIMSSLLGWQVAQAATAPHASSIVLGGVFDTGSNDAHAVAGPILAGYQLAFTQTNMTGGVKGATLNYDVENDNYDPSQTVPALKTLVESDKALAIAGVFGSDDSNAAIPYLKGAKVPFFDPIGGGAAVRGDAWAWQTEPSYGLEGKIMGHYITSKLKVTKVAAVYQEGVNEPEIASLEKYFHGSNFFKVSYQGDATDSDIGPLVTQVSDFHPQMVILLGTLIPTADFVKQSASVGFQPPKGWFANYPQGDPSWIALTEGCGCLQHAYVSSYADLTGQNPVAKAYKAAIKKYDPSQTYSNYGLYGYFNGMLIVRALKLAGTHPTRVKLQTILNTKFRKYKSGFTGALNWTPKYHYGVTQFKIYKINGSSFDPVTKWLSS